MGEISGADEKLEQQGGEIGGLAAPPDDAGGSEGDPPSGVAETPQGSAPPQAPEAVPEQTPSSSPGSLSDASNARPAENPLAQNTAPAQKAPPALGVQSATRGAQLAKEIEHLSKTAPNSPEYYVRLGRYFSVPASVVSMFPMDFALRFATEQYQRSLKENSPDGVTGAGPQAGTSDRNATPPQDIKSGSAENPAAPVNGTAPLEQPAPNASLTQPQGLGIRRGAPTKAPSAPRGAQEPPTFLGELEDQLKDKLKEIGEAAGHLFGHDSRQTVEVRKGDTLVNIAKRLGVPYQQLRDANPQIEDPAKIEIGDKINVPGHSGAGKTGTAFPAATASTDAAPGAQQGDTYVVKKGKNLLDLSEEMGVPIEILMQANHIKGNPWDVGAGTVIKRPQQSLRQEFAEWLDDKRHPNKVIDVDKTLSILHKNASPGYTGNCARSIWDAMKAAGTKLPETSHAKDGGPILEKIGFRKWTNTLDGYIPRKGDVVVIDKIPGDDKHQWGHMAMFDGKHWVSDTVQMGPDQKKMEKGWSGMWANLKYKDSHVPFTIYRP